MRSARAVLVCAALFVLSVVAQSPNGAINGQVLDPSGSAIADAGIVIVNDITGLQYVTKTNDEGIYVLANLPPGPYRLQVSKVGFKTLIKPDIILNVQDALAISFTLPIGALAQTVTVEGGAPLVNTESSAVSTVIDRKFVENIPLNGRSFQNLISMTPGVVNQSPQNQSFGQSVGSGGDFSVNGQRTESNYYTVDGVTANTSAGSGAAVPGPANGGNLAASTALGTTQSLVSVDALQEFRVQSSSYSAEYGRSPGGQFSLVTRSGTNTLAGTAFEYLRNSYVDANNWFNDHNNKPKPPLRQNDFGGTLGGPLRVPGLYDGRNRTFFFGSYEGLRLILPQAATVQYVPDVYLRQQAAPAIQPILAAFPLQNGIDYGTASSPSLAQFLEPYSLPAQIDSVSARVDQTLSSRLNLFFRYGNTQSFTSTRSLSTLSKQHVDAQTYTFALTGQLSNTSTIDFRWGYANTEAANQTVLDGFGGATSINLADALGGNVGPSAYSYFILSFSGLGTSQLQTSKAVLQGKQWNIVDTFRHSFGHHILRFGSDYRHIASPLLPASPQSVVEFFSAPSIEHNTVDNTFLSKNISATPVFKETAVFIQDDWRLVPHLNLSIGVRWEVNPPPTEAHGNDAYTLLGDVSSPRTLALAPKGTSLWRTTWYNFAPRLGIAWQPRDRASGWDTVVRGGAGVFFDTNNQLATVGYSGVGFSASENLRDEPLPLMSSNFNFAPSTTSPYTGAVVFAFPSHLQLPYAIEWNVALEQGFGKTQSMTASYVGSSGRRLGLIQTTQVQAINPNFGEVYSVQSGVTSNYQALQLKAQRSVPHGIQVLASYTWSHCLDYGSNDQAYPATRGNCDFDVRNNAQGGVSWDVPGGVGKGFAKVVLKEWGLDGRVTARSAFPITLQGNFLTDPVTGRQYYSGVNLVPGVPTYAYGSQYPGGRAVNRAAFSAPTGSTSGNAPRNFVRGFSATQLNVALRREFHLREHVGLQLRAEAFNILNHPNFGFVDPKLTHLLFGQATQTLNQSLGTMAPQYQQGGPRSMQFALKLTY